MALGWKGKAYNQVPYSKNEIHSDKVAKEFGFKGGLVPGVTVSAYLMHPAAVSYGMEFLERGFAHVQIKSPLYDKQNFEVEVQKEVYEIAGSGYRGVLRAERANLCATAKVRLPAIPIDSPLRRGDEISEKEDMPTMATRENFETLRKTGCKAFRYCWNSDHEMNSYLSDRTKMAKCFKIDGYANPSFILGVSNWVLASNVYMNPWLHMETRSQHYAAIPLDTVLVGEMEIKRVFEKKGHEFVDVMVNIFGVESNKCFASVELRAIYNLRQS